jgi:hypothetical protein
MVPAASLPLIETLPPPTQPPAEILGAAPAVTIWPPMVRVLIEVRLLALKLLVVKDPPTVRLPTTFRAEAVRILATVTAPCRLVMPETFKLPRRLASVREVPPLTFRAVMEELPACRVADVGADDYQNGNNPGN